MPNTCTPYNPHAPYFPMPKKPGNHTILALDEPDIWFDAQDSIQIEETWFDAGSVAYTGKHSPEENADSLVPFTEDCRRSIQQFVRMLGDYQDGKILSACISKLLPGVPVNLAMAANSLYMLIYYAMGFLTIELLKSYYLCAIVLRHHRKA